MPEPPAKVHEFVMGQREKSPGKVVGGSDRAVFNNALINATISAAWRPPNATPEERDKLVDTILIGMVAFKPEDEIEGMLAAQAMAMHHGAMENARRAMIPDQGFESGMACRKAAARYSRAFIDLLAALDRKRGKGVQQKVTVEHVHVHAGGQAIVGAIESTASAPGGGAKRKTKGKPHAPDQLAAPSGLGPGMPTLRRDDAEPAALSRPGDGERPVPDARRRIHRPPNR